ncbi:MAG TPA: TlpA disulfide reductase family protein [Burkholderiales bacterium]|jgi:peroxiredoxin|nr:TlpA disulfide reductase family protein [Burkholderiales bacterium]
MPYFRSWILLLALALANAAWAGAEIGAPAPPLRGTLFSGHPLDLQALRGKVVLVNFFSSYCKFCAYEIGNVQTFYEKHRAEGFEVIVVAIDDLADRARVEGMVGSYGLQGIMADDLERSGFERRYPTPTAFVIDRKGVVRSQTRGAKLPFWFAEQVTPLLAEP